MVTSIFEKISSYNILNNLLPGVAFCEIVNMITRFDIRTGSVWKDLFVMYFTGIVISRIGSVIVEEGLKRLSFRGKKAIERAKYPEYLEACKHDKQIEILNETNNTYRTIIAMLICIAIVYIYDKYIYMRLCNSTEIMIIGVLCFLIILFILSYRKQTNYIRKRVDKVNKDLKE